MFRSRYSRLFNRAIIWCLAAILLLASVPLPIANRSVESKDLSEVYPCAHSACGCKSAEQCWRSCCCHTIEQRLEFAAKHNIKLPDDIRSKAKSNDRKDKKLVGEVRDCTRCKTNANKSTKHANDEYLIVMDVAKCRGYQLMMTIFPWTIDSDLACCTIEQRSSPMIDQPTSNPTSAILFVATPPPRYGCVC
jgi:hypothetical protein